MRWQSILPLWYKICWLQSILFSSLSQWRGCQICWSSQPQSGGPNKDYRLGSGKARNPDDELCSSNHLLNKYKNNFQHLLFNSYSVYASHTCFIVKIRTIIYLLQKFVIFSLNWCHTIIQTMVISESAYGGFQSGFAQMGRAVEYSHPGPW